MSARSQAKDTDREREAIGYGSVGSDDGHHNVACEAPIRFRIDDVRISSASRFEVLFGSA